MKDINNAEINFRHRVPVQIRFNDIDMFGHLNNTVYLQFFDMGKYAYFRSFMDGPFGSEPTAPVVANINVDFHKPTFIDEKLTVCTAVTEIAESSMVMQQVIINEKGTIKCSARVVMVNVDVKTGLPVPVTREWRDKLGAYENRNF